MDVVGDIKFFRQILVVLQYRKNSWEPLNVSERFWCRKNFMDFFLSHFTENFLVELFGVSENFRQRKSCMDERVGYHVSLLKFCLPTVPRNFKRELVLTSENFRQRNFFGCDGLYQVLPPDFVCLTVPKKIVGTVQCLTKFLVSRIFHGC